MKSSEICTYKEYLATGQCPDPMMTYKTGVMGRRVGLESRYFRTAAEKVGQNFAQGFC